MGEDGPEDPGGDTDPLVFLDGAKTLLDIVAGYRAMAESIGFSPMVAEQMALHVHAQLIEGVFRQKGVTR